MKEKNLNTKELSYSLLKDLGKIIDKDPSKLSVRIFENSSGVQFTLEEFLNSYNPEEIQKGQCNLIVRIDIGEHALASFTLKDMYNCCGIIVGSDLYVSEDYSNKGVGTLLTKFMMDFSKYYGYGVLQATDREDNEYQKKIFEKLGWIVSHKFRNPKTNNNLIMWLYNIN